MQYLEAVSRTPESSWYELLGDHQGEVRRWVMSTPQTVRVCNQSDLVGVEFTRVLRQGMAAAMGTAPFRQLLEEAGSSRLCVLNFLRGGLNFDLRGVLFDALGSNHHATCFMSSQRYREEGRWRIKEDMYRKIRIPDAAVLLIADVVATGVTAENGLEVLEQHLVDHGATLKGMVFFTLGCHKTEKILEAQHARFKERFEGYEETHAVYIEGKFRLVDSTTKLLIGIPGTDLIKRRALLSPELELAQYDALAPALERCIIYDAGSRAFDIREYLDDVIEYWEQVRLLARRGHTLVDALKERWPEAEYADSASLRTAKQTSWRGVEGRVIDELWDRYQARWSEAFTSSAATPAALHEVAVRRLDRLGSLTNELEKRGDHS